VSTTGSRLARRPLDSNSLFIIWGVVVGICASRNLRTLDSLTLTAPTPMQFYPGDDTPLDDTTVTLWPSSVGMIRKALG